MTSRVHALICFVTYNFADYVQKMRATVFALTKEQRKLIKEESKARVPPPISSQFTGKQSKQEAMEAYNLSKSKTAELFPAGTNVNTCSIN